MAEQAHDVYERRRFLRFVARLRVHYAQAAGWAIATTRDVSQGGMALYSAPGLTSGDRREFQLHLLGEALPVAGKVVNVGPEIANVAFAEGSVAAAQRIREYAQLEVIPRLELSIGGSDDTDSLIHLAAWYRELGRADNALQLYRNALQVGQRSIEFFEHMALFLLDRLQHPGADAKIVLAEIGNVAAEAHTIGRSPMLEAILAEAQERTLGSAGDATDDKAAQREIERLRESVRSHREALYRGFSKLLKERKQLELLEHRLAEPVSEEDAPPLPSDAVPTSHEMIDLIATIRDQLADLKSAGRTTVEINARPMPEPITVPAPDVDEDSLPEIVPEPLDEERLPEIEAEPREGDAPQAWPPQEERSEIPTSQKPPAIQALKPGAPEPKRVPAAPQGRAGAHGRGRRVRGSLTFLSLITIALGAAYLANREGLIEFRPPGPIEALTPASSPERLPVAQPPGTTDSVEPAAAAAATDTAEPADVPGEPAAVTDESGERLPTDRPRRKRRAQRKLRPRQEPQTTTRTPVPPAPDPPAENPVSAAERHYQQGLTLFKQRKVMLAIEELEKAVAADRSHVNAHLSLGLALTVLGQHERAATAYRRFLKLAPGHPKAAQVRKLLEQQK